MDKLSKVKTNSSPIEYYTKNNTFKRYNKPHVKIHKLSNKEG